MFSNNFATYGVKILVEIGRDILMFPVWWYSRGLMRLVRRLVNFLKNHQKSLGLGIWVKNIFRPMYGQQDWQGRLISIGMRLVQIVLRSIGMVFWVIVAVVILLAWIMFPVFVLYQIIFQLR